MSNNREAAVLPLKLNTECAEVCVLFVDSKNLMCMSSKCRKSMQKAVCTYF